ncbi:MAG: glycosyltransferase family 2 protein [Xanthobacteraceae bacterium]
MSGEKYRLAVCFPVWNRADLFKASFESLLGQLDGVEASIWVFDNGSDAQTKELIGSLRSSEHRVFKVSLPENMGIPFVVNIFSHSVGHDCEYVGYRSPTHIMIADADAYFHKPVRDMLEILESNERFAIISGHDSVEHETVAQHNATIRGEPVVVKEKKIERGLCLIMRKEMLAGCVPFPHHINQEVDWELMLRHPNSSSAQGRAVAAVSYVEHLGLYDSTWHPVGVPATAAEAREINRILEQHGLLSADRRKRMEAYCRAFNLDIAEPGKRDLTRRWAFLPAGWLLRLVDGK